MDKAAQSIVNGRGVFLSAFLLAMVFALATNHVWEDYYITYRPSKNLATGHGLVYNIGERLHTFTSPLGVLLPAAASLLTLNQSDDAALWIFRIWSAAAFAGAATLMHAASRRLGHHPAVSLVMVGWMITDSKSLDFSVNGMETGFLLLFLAYAVWALVAGDARRWLHLGIAWGGLMWTRPDGFIYIGALAAGALLFNDRERSGLTRLQWLRVLAGAALVCTLIYLPWFAGTWLYYGTPVPHTVIAKASSAGSRSFFGALEAFIRLPVDILLGSRAVDGIFLPANATFGDWPQGAVVVARALTGIGAWLWVLPWVIRWETRVTSFAFCVLLTYLGYYPGYPAAWYLPGPSWLALFAGGSALNAITVWLRARPAPWLSKMPQAAGRVCQRSADIPVCPVWLAKIPQAAGWALLAFGSWLTIQSGKIAVVEQTVLHRNRREIGQWLKEHAAPGDRVFLECLGFIGFYSGLRTYDYPGMSSPEVVKAGREVGQDWGQIIARLEPEWLVLRPTEAAGVIHSNRRLLDERYRVARVFDTADRVSQAQVYGRAALAYDSVFLVFHHVSDATPPIPGEALDKSVVYIEKTLAVWPDYARGLGSLGTACLDRGQPEKASGYFEKALALDPGLKEARFNLGVALLQRGETGEAIKQYRRALDQWPEFIPARNDLGNLLFRLGRIGEARAEYQKVVDLYPGHAAAHNNLGNACFRMGAFAEARSHYEKAAELSPDEWAFRNNLAWLLATCTDAATRNGQKATELAQEAARLSGTRQPAILRTLAAAAAESGDFQSALATAKEAENLASDQGNAGLAEKLRKDGELYWNKTPNRTAADAVATP